MTDKDSKEREAFEHAERASDLRRDDDCPDEYRNQFVQAAWDGWRARASLAANAGSEPVAQLAAERDELFQAAIDFIRTLTGMEPPPIEVAPPEVFAPFHAFVNTIQAITNKRNSPPREGMVMVPKEPTHHMLNAAASAYKDARQSLGAYNAPWAAYRAMLEVAAHPPHLRIAERGSDGRAHQS